MTLARAWWITPPENQGQIVEVAYLSDGEHIYRRTTDRSDGGSVRTERVRAPSIDEEDWTACDAEETA